MITSISSSANPAPLKVTQIASHMIATVNFLNFRLTLWTKRYFEVALGPLCELFLHVFLARCPPTVVIFLAFKANVLTAHWTRDFLSFEIVCSHPTITSRSSTISDQWIIIKLLLFSKSIKFFEGLVVINEDYSDLFFCYLSIATV